MIRTLAALTLLATPAGAVSCEGLDFLGISFTICEVDVATEGLRLFHTDQSGNLLGSFSAIEDEVAPKALTFAMNAGMYHKDRSPVGHYVEDGIEKMRVISDAGPGNFGMLPNGIFCIRESEAFVIETQEYLAQRPICQYATQSGPMLVIDGQLHPRFIPGSDSLKIRNGVGTSTDGARAVFAIADEPVNFHDFALLFRDALGLREALYFDGSISRLHAPALGRSDMGFAMGPIVGVVADVDEVAASR